MLQLSASEEQTLEYILESVTDNISEYVPDMEMYATSDNMMFFFSEEQIQDLKNILSKIQHQ